MFLTPRPLSAACESSSQLRQQQNISSNLLFKIRTRHRHMLYRRNKQKDFLVLTLILFIIRFVYRRTNVRQDYGLCTAEKHLMYLCRKCWVWFILAPQKAQMAVSGKYIINMLMCYRHRYPLLQCQLRGGYEKWMFVVCIWKYSSSVSHITQWLQMLRQRPL